MGGEIGCATNFSNVTANLPLQFDAIAGIHYTIEISGVGQNLGSVGRVTLTVQAMPSIAVSAGTANLAGGQTTQFTATVTGTPNTAVRWTAQYGRIDANGNYTAPANLTSGQTLTDAVTATSLADPNASSSVPVTVQM
jgi:hypothetical protein